MRHKITCDDIRAKWKDPLFVIKDIYEKTFLWTIVFLFIILAIILAIPFTNNINNLILEFVFSIVAMATYIAEILHQTRLMQWYIICELEKQDQQAGRKGVA